MQTAKRLLALLLTVLLLATPLLAAGPQEGLHQSRAEDLSHLVETLEQVHPDMYANTTRQAVAEKQQYILDHMDQWNDTAFSLELRSLIGLVGDSHTNLGIKVTDNYKKLLVSIEPLGGQWILTGALKEHAQFVGGQVTAMGGLTMEQVQERFGTSLCADNAVWAQRVMGRMLHLWDVLAHIGMVEPSQPSLDITVRGRDGVTGTVTISPLTNDESNALFASGQMQQRIALLQDLRTDVPATEPQNVYYQWQDLGGGNLYIQYNTCMEDPELPMADFADQVSAALEAQDYGRILIDLRYNGGGSDGVIWGLLEQLLPYQQRGVELYALIGEGTFSSALINAVQLQQLGATLVGTPTGGSVDHFGSVRSFQLSNSGWRVTHSTKFIDMGGYYQSADPYGVESLQPDVLAAQTVSDYLAGVDTAVQAILNAPATVPEATAAAQVSDAAVLVDGAESALTGYRIDGEHYVALRDVAAALNGTAAQFQVLWKPDDLLCVGVLPGQAYTPVGGELSPLLPSAQATAGSVPLLTPGGMPLQLLGQPGGLRVYSIADRHYLRLRDLGGKLGFAVQWDAAAETVRIETK